MSVATATKLKPLGDKVVVKILESEEKTKGGIFLPDTAKEKPQQGKVIAVGPGKILDNGTRATIDLQVDNIVIFAKYAGTEVKVDGVEYLVISEKDILAVVE
jgi:chaperonin GroES